MKVIFILSSYASTRLCAVFGATVGVTWLRSTLNNLEHLPKLDQRAATIPADDVELAPEPTS